MVSCAVLDCNTSTNYNPQNYTFHRLPQNPYRRKKWLRMTKIRIPRKFTSICSKHFEERCFSDTEFRRRLRKEAVPTLFMPVSLQPPQNVSSYQFRDISPVPSSSTATTPSNVEKPGNSLSEKMTDEFKQRLIRFVASYVMREKKPMEQLLADYSKEAGCDFELLWEHVRALWALTLKKLNLLLATEDKRDIYSEPVQLTETDWLLVNEVLVHENVDLIGQDSATDYPQLYELFELVQQFHIEGLRGEELVKAWNQITTIYNKHGLRGSLMLLQRRWYQLKAATRRSFYKFWKFYRGISSLLSRAKQFSMPTQLQIDIAKRYPDVIIKTFPAWEELIEKELVVLYDDHIKNTGKDKLISCGESEPDIAVVEPDIKAINMRLDSDLEDVAKTKEQKESNVNKSNGVDSNKTSQDNSSQCAIHESSDIELQNDYRKTYVDTDINISIKKEQEEDTDGLSNIKIVETFHVPMELKETDNKKFDNNPDQSSYQHIKVDGAELKQETCSLDTVCVKAESLESSKEGGLSFIRDNASDNSFDTLSEEMLPKIEENIIGNAIIYNNTAIKNSGYQMKTPTHLKPTLDDIIKRKVNEYIENVKDEEIEVKKNVLEPFDVLPSHFDNGMEFTDEGIEFVKDNVEHNEVLPDKETGSSPERQVQADISDDDYNGGNDDDVDVDFKVLPVVYTTKLEHMTIFNHTILNGVKDLDLIKRIAFESKPTTERSVDVNKKKKKRKYHFNHRSNENVTWKSEYMSNVMKIAKKKVELSSCLLKKPENRFYDFVKLCKNPDFNTKLKRLPISFFNSTRNIRLLNACKPVTVDVDKRFESELINGTLHIKSNCPSIKFSDERNTDTECEQTVSVIPSAISVQSLIDYNTVIELKNSKYAVNLPQEKIDGNVLPESNKVIKLPDIANQQLLVAEVTPIQIKDTLNSIEPPIKIISPVDTKYSNEKNVSFDHCQNELGCSNSEYTQLKFSKDIKAVDSSRYSILEQNKINKTIEIDPKVVDDKMEEEKIYVNKMPKDKRHKVKSKHTTYNSINRIPLAEDALLTPDALNKMLYVMNIENVDINTDSENIQAKLVTSISQSCQTDICQYKDKSCRNKKGDNKQMEKVKCKRLGDPKLEVEKNHPPQAHKHILDISKYCCQNDLSYAMVNNRKKIIEPIIKSTCSTVNSVALGNKSLPSIKTNIIPQNLSTNRNLENSQEKEVSATSNPETVHLSLDTNNLNSTSSTQMENIVSLERIQDNNCTPCTCKQPNVSLDTFQRHIIIDGSQYCQQHSAQNNIPGNNAKRILHLKSQQTLKNYKKNESPIILEKNSLLLTTAKLPQRNSILFLKNVKGHASNATTKENSLKLISPLLSSNRVQLALLPNGEITYSTESGIVLDAEEIATLKVIANAVRQQINVPFSVPKSANNPYPNNIKSNEIKLTNVNSTALDTLETEHDQSKIKTINELNSITNTRIQVLSASSVADKHKAHDVIQTEVRIQSNPVNHEEKQKLNDDTSNKDISFNYNINYNSKKDNNVENYKADNEKTNENVPKHAENFKEKVPIIINYFKMSNFNNDINANKNYSSEVKESVDNSEMDITKDKTMLSDPMVGISAEDTESELQDTITPELQKKIEVTPIPQSRLQEKNEIALTSPLAMQRVLHEPHFAAASQNTSHKEHKTACSKRVIEQDNINTQDVVDPKNLLELTPVRTFSELKHARKKNGHFFKLDFDTGIMVPINVFIRENKIADLHQKHCKEIIDLTNEKITLNTYSNKEGTIEINLNKMSKDYANVQQKSVIEKTYIQTNEKGENNNIVSPVEFLKADVIPTTLRRSSQNQAAGIQERIDKENNNNKKDEIFNNKRKQEQNLNEIDTEIDLVNSDGPMKEKYVMDNVDSDDGDFVNVTGDYNRSDNSDNSSEDEPLSKKIKKSKELENEDILQIKRYEDRKNRSHKQILDKGHPNRSFIKSFQDWIVHRKYLTETEEPNPVPVDLVYNNNNDNSDNSQEDCILGY